MKGWFVFLFVCCLSVCSHSQDHAAARYEINAKRIGVNPTDKDALPRSREFLRLDSTYYVGWMYEGMYKYDRSADFLGYKNAIVPLHKALVLLNKDFAPTLRNIYSSIPFFFGKYRSLSGLFYNRQCAERVLRQYRNARFSNGFA